MAYSLLSDLSLPRDPLTSNYAATKNYVDLQDSKYQTYSSTAPSNPQLGWLWTDSSAAPILTLKQWNGSTWSTVADNSGLTQAAADTRYINTAGDTMTGDLILNANPTSSLGAATKQYVDITSQGFSFKHAVKVVAIINIPILSGLLTIDGITLVAGDRVLLTAQTTPAQNGIYIAAADAWTRATDMDATGELVDGTLVPVSFGSAGADSQYMCIATSTTPWVPGTSSSTWTRWSSIADLGAGAGLTKSGSVIDFVGDSNLSVGADLVSVLSAPKWTTARTLTLSGSVTGSASIDGSANVTLTTTSSTTKFTQTLVGGSTVEIITHNLGTKDVIVQLYEIISGNTVSCDVQRVTTNTVALGFDIPPAGSTYKVVIV